MEFSNDMNGSLSQLSSQGANLLNNLKELSNQTAQPSLDLTNGLNALGAASGFQGASTQLNPSVNLGLPNATDPTVLEGFKQWLASNLTGTMPVQQTLPNCLPASAQLLNNPLLNPVLPMKFSDPAALLYGAQAQGAAATAAGAVAALQSTLGKALPANGLGAAAALGAGGGEGEKAQKPRNKATKRSRYRGVYWNKGSRSWRSLISINGKTQHLGNFNSQEEAAQEFDRKARELKRTKLNFPDREVAPPKSPESKAAPPGEVEKSKSSPSSEGAEPEEEPGPEAEQVRSEDEVNPKCKSKLQCPSSKYRGVYYVKQRNEWRARIWNDGKSEHLGNFETEQEAAKEFDRRSKELGRDNLNFPESKV